MAFLRDKNFYGRRPSLKIQKTELRSQYMEKRKAIPEEQKKAFDAAICRRIINTVSFRFATTVLLYAALPSEIDVSELAAVAIAQGKQIAFPRCIPGTPLMNFHTVTDISVLQKGSYSIMEPPEDAPIWRLRAGERAICIIPGLLFDPSGHRIGYGKGFYDRYLSDKEVQRIGVVYDEFILDRLPHGKYDLSADVIVSEKRLLSVKK